LSNAAYQKRKEVLRQRLAGTIWLDDASLVPVGGTLEE